MGFLAISPSTAKKEISLPQEKSLVFEFRCLDLPPNESVCFPSSPQFTTRYIFGHRRFPSLIGRENSGVGVRRNLSKAPNWTNINFPHEEKKIRSLIPFNLDFRNAPGEPPDFFGKRIGVPKFCPAVFSRFRPRPPLSESFHPLLTPHPAPPKRNYLKNSFIFYFLWRHTVRHIYFFPALDFTAQCNQQQQIYPPPPPLPIRKRTLPFPFFSRTDLPSHFPLPPFLSLPLGA